jgi:hypothetical protein
MAVSSKALPISIQFSREQRRKIERAARVVGRERGGEEPALSALVREETMKGVEAILSRESEPAVAA